MLSKNLETLYTLTIENVANFAEKIREEFIARNHQYTAKAKEGKVPRIVQHVFFNFSLFSIVKVQKCSQKN